MSLRVKKNTKCQKKFVSGSKKIVKKKYKGIAQNISTSRGSQERNARLHTNLLENKLSVAFNANITKHHRSSNIPLLASALMPLTFGYPQM